MNAERWVVNSSPLILLAKIGRLDLLVEQAQTLVVPQTVVQEILAGPKSDPARIFLQKGIVTTVPVSPHPDMLSWDLGAGETAVLSYAMANEGWTAILDDGAARKCAHTFDISIKGTLAVVIRAKRYGLIPSAADVLHLLKSLDHSANRNASTWGAWVRGW